MQITEAIILAGGLGTRLRAAVSDLPKSMAPVAGKPFIDHIINYYSQQGIKQFVFSLGYKSEIIVEHLKTNFKNLSYSLVVEKKALGTGGAILLACQKSQTENPLILNGDTFFQVNLQSLSEFHDKTRADCTLVLKPMKNSNRYGTVELGAGAEILSFKEKAFFREALINGGIYVLNKNRFLTEGLPDKHSFEKDYLEQFIGKRKIFGQIQDRYFIDIGIPEDFERAQTELADLLK